VPVPARNVRAPSTFRMFLSRTGRAHFLTKSDVSFPVGTPAVQMFRSGTNFTAVWRLSRGSLDRELPGDDEPPIG
jgi:hypothetical protein